MMSMTRVAAAAALAAASIATPAAAEDYQFVLNGALQATWLIGTTQSTYKYYPGESSVFADVYGDYSRLPGFSPATNYVAFIEFYTDDLDGGFFIEDFYGRTDPNTTKPILTVSGPSVITGDTSAPSFLLGTYKFYDASDANKKELYSLTISVVPEPASWAMMIAGFAIIGATIRRRSMEAATLVA